MALPMGPAPGAVLREGPLPDHRAGCPCCPRTAGHDSAMVQSRRRRTKTPGPPGTYNSGCAEAVQGAGRTRYGKSSETRRRRVLQNGKGQVTVTVHSGRRVPSGQTQSPHPRQRPCLDCGVLTRATRCPACTRLQYRAKDALRGTASERHYGPAWRKLSAAVLERDGRICHWCGTTATTADHVVPRRQGGSDDMANLVAACRPCNSGRTPPVKRPSD